MSGWSNSDAVHPAMHRGGRLQRAASTGQTVGGTGFSLTCSYNIRFAWGQRTRCRGEETSENGRGAGDGTLSRAPLLAQVLGGMRVC